MEFLFRFDSTSADFLAAHRLANRVGCFRRVVQLVGVAMGCMWLAAGLGAWRYQMPLGKRIAGTLTGAAMIWRFVLESIHAPQFSCGFVRAKKEKRHVEHVRSKIGKDAEPLVPPRRVTHIARGAVAVKEFRQINLAEYPLIDKLLQLCNVRFEAMVVSGITCGAILSREFD